jgi:hypothetical protein
MATLSADNLLITEIEPEGRGTAVRETLILPQKRGVVVKPLISGLEDR